MKGFFILFLLSAASCFLVGCSRPSSVAEKPANANSSAANENPNFDVCAMVGNDEIAGIQGEAVVNTKNSSRVVNSLLVSQCFYELKTYSKSVSFEITQTAPNASDKVDLEKMWEEKFNREIFADNDREEEEEREEREERKESEEKEESEESEEPGKTSNEQETGAKPQAVPDLGEAAFRVGNRITNALYVLKDKRIIRVSIGGADDQKTKLEKLKQIAQNALKRM